MKKLFAALLVLCVLCGSTALAADYTDVFSNFDQRDSWTEAVTVTFGDDGVQVNGSGVEVEGTTARVNQAGTYLVSGDCANGQLIVAVDKAEKVQLVLNGLRLTCADSAPLYVIGADKVSITLASGSVNTLTDSAVYTREFDKAPTACLYSRDDLTINGTGELTVNGNSNNGIGCKNDLKIVSGTITVNAVKNALKGNDSVAIKDGLITLTAGKDGIKADNVEEAGKGYVYIAGGVLTISAGDDAIQAAQDVTVTGGSVKTHAEGKTVNSKGTQEVVGGAIVKQ